MKTLRNLAIVLTVVLFAIGEIVTIFKSPNTGMYFVVAGAAFGYIWAALCGIISYRKTKYSAC